MKLEKFCAMDMVNRLDYAKRNPIKCVACDTNQVQLVDYRTDELEWKCRHCGATMLTSLKRYFLEVAE